VEAPHACGAPLCSNRHGITAPFIEGNMPSGPGWSGTALIMPDNQDWCGRDAARIAVVGTIKHSIVRVVHPIVRRIPAGFHVVVERRSADMCASV
jgi:hypothetical protein